MECKKACVKGRRRGYSPNSSKSCIDLKRQSVHSVSKPRSARAAGLSTTAAGAVRGAGGSETSHPVQREERRGREKKYSSRIGARLNLRAWSGIDRLSARLASFTHRDHTYTHASAAAQIRTYTQPHGTDSGL